MKNYAVVFPGQGSQFVGMLSDFEQSSIVKETFEQASDALGYGLWALTQQGPEEELNPTHRTQPALLTSSVAIWRLWQSQTDIQPSQLAGHSLGEYSALVCAGVFDLDDGVKLVEKRGELMQKAVPEGVGSMAAIIGLDDEKIETACLEAAQGQIVSPVNYNSPGQVVIAGNQEAVGRASELCKEFGAKRAMPLAVSVPSHCALMKPAADEFAQFLAAVNMRSPVIDVVNNVDVAIETTPEAIQHSLLKQLYSPVQWTASVQSMIDTGVSQFFEMGPGKVLTGLSKRINKSVPCANIGNESTLNDALAWLKNE
ncbi:ACP S-malonyltransferase [Algicola sagamiensis]|uniref:ACP S-malonyltransferase n=1 Tax=Algicola sagamiensis TaxID=163869 RepID=UPI00037F6BD9|nr:ACP S-malonyltransferase [Algicola sagamiensis]